MVFNNIYSFSDNLAQRTNLDFRYLISNSVDKIYDFIDMVNLFKFRQNIFDGTLTVLHLKLSDNDIIHFDETSKQFVNEGHKISAINTWRNADLRVGADEFSVKVKLHGDSSSHWRNNERSYKVKMNGPYLNQMRRFNLILFEDRFLRGSTASILAKHFNLYNVKDEIVVLKINGVTQGIYYLQEAFDKNFLERNKCSNCVTFKRSDDYWAGHVRMGDHGLIYDYSGHITPFDYDISSSTMSSTDLDHQFLNYKLDQLFTAVKEGDSKKIIELFDIDSLSSFEALRRIMGFTHDIEGDNLILVYSASTGKFTIVPQSEEIRKIRLNNGGIENFMNLNGKEFIPLFYYINQNDNFRLLTNKKIYSLVTQENDVFIKEIEDLNELITPYATSYNMKERSSNYAKFILNYEKDSIHKNMRILKENLEYNKLYANVRTKQNTINFEIIPDSISALTLNSIKLNFSEPYFGKVDLVVKDEFDQVLQRHKFFFEKENLEAENGKGYEIDVLGKTNELLLMSTLDKELFPKKKTYHLEYVFDKKVNLISSKINVLNVVTSQPLKDKDIHISIATENNYFDIGDADNFVKETKDLLFVYEKDGFTLLPGEYILNEDIIVPRASNLLISSGTTIKIAEGKSFISLSPIIIKDKVIVTAQNKNKPFGTFAFLGKPGDVCQIEGLDLSFGKEALVNGVYYSGGLSIHNCDTTIRNSKIHHNSADDGLNIKYGNVLLEGNVFSNNFADQVDLDFTEGAVLNNIFKNPGKSGNGDGLDLSGSKMLVKQNIFTGFEDKALSIGEATTSLVIENSFEQNNISIAVKDASTVFVEGNIIEDSNIAINNYMKKPLFGGSETYDLGNQYLNNIEIHKKDKESVIYTNTPENVTNTIKKLTAKENYPLLYKFLSKI